MYDHHIHIHKLKYQATKFHKTNVHLGVINKFVMPVKPSHFVIEVPVNDAIGESKESEHPPDPFAHSHLSRRL